MMIEDMLNALSLSLKKKIVLKGVHKEMDD